MAEDLYIILFTAGVISLLFKICKQPVVLGYIVAGMAVGPYMLGEAWIDNPENVTEWSEIGVLFLLFSLGLEFSVKKLIQVGTTAFISTSVIVLGMMSSGYLIGNLLGFNSLNSLFLGGMLCMSSTTIVFKAIDDGGLRAHKFAKICFGTLVVEDLFAVVLMVLLSSIAVKNEFEGKEMLLQIGKLLGYLVLWFIFGISVIPSFLRRFRKHLNNETLTIISLALCLGMVAVAVRAGFSSALGAFVMGSILAETLEAERIEFLIQPVKNIFGAIFFVSVGMMINPALLLEYWVPILVITLTVILGQIVFASFGTLLSGQTLRVSLQTGFSLVQIGEFAFIIAQLGQELGVTAPSLYPIVVAVSVITTFLTPYIMRLAEPAYNLLYAHLSDETKHYMDCYIRLYQRSSSDNVITREISTGISDTLQAIISFVPLLRRLNKNFTKNFYAREQQAEFKRGLNHETESLLLSLDIHISEFDIPDNSSFCGRALMDLNIRSKSGVSIVRIIRRGININIPGGGTILYGGDKLVVAGLDEQMTRFQQLLDKSINDVKHPAETTQEEKDAHNITLRNMPAASRPEIIGKSIRDTMIHEKARCLIMGIINADNIQMNPPSSYIITEDDFLILAGEKSKLDNFVRE